MEVKSLMRRESGHLPLSGLREEMDRLFDDWLAGAGILPRVLGDGDRFMPRIDVAERADGVEVKAELPGVEQPDIEVELTRNSLLLRGQKKLEIDEKREGYARSERRFGSFLREIPLPWEVDVEKAKVDTKFANGVLDVKVRKPAGTPPARRKISLA
jgi:HSP20 family protein